MSFKSDINALRHRLLLFLVGFLLISSAGVAQKIYWIEATSNRLQRANLDGSNVETDYLSFTAAGSTDPSGLAIDAQHNYVYWTDYSGADVWYGKLEPGGVTGASVVFCVSCSVGAPSGIDLDPSGGKMYFANDYEGGVDQVDLDGSNDVLSFALGSGTGVYPVDVDEVNGVLYWGEPSNNIIDHVLIIDGSSRPDINITGTIVDLVVDHSANQIYYTTVNTGIGSIRRVGTDGTGDTEILGNLPGAIMGIDIDISTGKMYWSEGGGSPLIARANMADGSAREDIITLAATEQATYIALDLSDDASPRVYWSENLGDGLGGDDDIHRVDLDGADFEVMYSGFSGEISGLEIDTANNLMYWTDAARAEILRDTIEEHGFNSTFDKLVDYDPSSTSGLWDLALDISQGHMYFTHYDADAGTNKVMRANLDGTGIVDRVDVDALDGTSVDEPFGIDLDLANGKMYFTTNWPNTGIDAKLWRANLDGTGVELVFEQIGGPDYFRDVKIDDTHQRVYWSAGPIDGAPGTIYYQDLNTPVPYFLTNSFSFGGEPRGIDIDPINDQIYWVCRGEGNGSTPAMIMRADLNGNSIETVFTVFKYPNGYPGSADAGSAFIALDLRGIPLLNLVSTTPSANSYNVPRNSNLTFTFDANVATVNSSNITVYGEQTGLIAGTFSGGGTSTITFDPTTDFRAGEVIRVSVHDVQGLGGEVMQGGEYLEFWAASGLAPSSPVLFQERILIDSSDPGQKEYVVGADIDLDGDLDLAVPEDGFGDDFQWFQNDGSQNFTAIDIMSGLANSRVTTTGDIDMDGDIDLFTAWSGRLDWFDNDGSQNFTQTFIFQTGVGGGLENTMVMDFDADGDMDVVINMALFAGADRVAWLENDGTQSFTRHDHYSADDGNAGVYAVDMEGDGDVDLLSFRGVAPFNLMWYENDGNENFTERIITTTLPSWAREIIPGDLDGDGDLDLAVPTSAGGSWFQNDGSQNFTEISLFPGNMENVHIADLDGDGDLDITGIRALASQMYVFENDGSGGFIQRIFTTTVDSNTDVYVADADNDGDLDILATGQSGSKLVWFENTSVASPEINVYLGSDNTGTAITSGQATAIDVGGTLVGTDLDQTFAIENTGAAALTIGGIAVAGPEYSITGTVPTSVAVGATETFTLRLDGSATGTFTDVVTISNNDADEGSFTFPVTGLVSDAGISVFSGSDTTGTMLSDGQTTAVDLGSTNQFSALIVDFVIENPGSATLNVQSITVDNPVFTVLNAPTSVAPGTFEVFSIRVDEMTPGMHTGTVTVTSDLGDYTFPIQAEVIDVGTSPPLVIYNAVSPNGDGRHDYLRIENIEAYDGSLVQVFSKLGNLVWTIDDYDNADPARRFEGVANKGSEGDLPNGTYYYFIDKKRTVEGSSKESGFFVLTR